MIKFAIYENDRNFLDILCNNMYNTISKNNFNAKITLFDNAQSALKSLEKNAFDVLYISISESDDSGFQIAQKARRNSDGTVIVFGAKSEKLLLKSMDYQPFSFIIKDSSGNTDAMLAELSRTTVRITRRFNQSRYIPIGGKVKLVSQMFYAKSDGHYLDYHCDGEVLSVRENISDAEKQLGDYDFLRIHRQYIVNMAKITDFYQNACSIIISSGETLPLSRTNRSEIAEKYAKFKQSRQNQ